MDAGRFILSLFDLKTAAIVALVFIPLERLLPLRRAQPIRRKSWSTDLVFLVANGALIRLALILVVAALVTARAAIVPMDVLRAVAGQPLWLQILEVILLADIGVYATHRLFHAAPRLWRFHAIHHGIEELDWLASFRVHPIDQVLTTTASLILVLACGFSDAAVAIYALIYRWHSLLLHSNVKLRLGWLGYVIATPEFHHWHHTRDPAARDKNFASQIALLDLLFGTLHLPKGQAVDDYGTDTPLPGGYVDQLCHPFRKAALAASPDGGGLPGQLTPDQPTS